MINLHDLDPASQRFIAVEFSMELSGAGNTCRSRSFRELRNNNPHTLMEYFRAGGAPRHVPAPAPARPVHTLWDRPGVLAGAR